LRIQLNYEKMILKGKISQVTSFTLGPMAQATLVGIKKAGVVIFFRVGKN
jgi:hypothetical protein